MEKIAVAEYGLVAALPAHYEKNSGSGIVDQR